MMKYTALIIATVFATSGYSALGFLWVVLAIIFAIKEELDYIFLKKMAKDLEKMLDKYGKK
jgi:hypothetical protein